MKAAQLRSLTDEELRQQESDLKRELLDMRVQQAVGQLEKPLRLRGLRRDLARVRTIARERAGKKV